MGLDCTASPPLLHILLWFLLYIFSCGKIFFARLQVILINCCHLGVSMGGDELGVILLCHFGLTSDWVFFSNSSTVFLALTFSLYYAAFLLHSFFLSFFLAVLGLRFCARTFSSCGKRGPLFIAVRGPLTIATSLVAEHRLQTLRLSSCGSWAQLLHSMWDLPRPGLKPVSPALAGRFSTTVPPGKPPSSAFLIRQSELISKEEGGAIF